MKLSLGALVLTAMSACSEKDGPTTPTAQTDETRYLRVSIAANNINTRALADGDFDEGVANESEVKTLDFYFYDSHKDYVSHVHISNPEIGAGTGLPAHVNDKVITSVVPVELVQGAAVPNYVLVMLNAADPSQLETKKMEDAQKELVSSYKSNDGFVMNNSVYYGNDVVPNTPNTLIMATPFDAKILKTKSEMQKLVDEGTAVGATSEQIAALKEATIDCYVERIAAKVTLKGAGTGGAITVNDYTSSNGVTLKFVPEGWALNNIETKSYIVKSYRVDDGTTFRTFADVNANLFWDWNDAVRFRSYWGASPAYYTAKYPAVADDILDKLGTGDVYSPEYTGTYDFSTHYQTYNYFKNTGNTLHNTISQPIYSLESTVTEDILKGGISNPLAAIESAIVIGHYEIGGTPAPTFYTYGSASGKATVYCGETAIAGTTKLIDYMLKNQKVVFSTSDNTPSGTRNYDLSSNGTNFKIAHPAKESREGLKIASRIVTLQHVTATNDANLFFYDPQDGTTKRLDGMTNIARANRLLYESLGGASAYTEGRAFFSAPIQHYGWHRDGHNTINTGSQEANPNMGKAQNEWDWSKMRVGDFGVVRNHSYTLQINGISGLGTGILGMDDPLLTPSDNVTYSMRFQILIQKWAVLPTQSVDW